MGIILTLFFSLLGFVFVKSKPLTVIIFLYMWLLFGWNFMNGDYVLYEQIYNNEIESVSILNYEGGYALLMMVCKSLGFTFQQFFIVISALILLLILRFVLVVSKKPATIAVLILLFILPIQFVLLRNFLSFAIAMQGILAVLTKSNKKYLKFSIFTFLAATVHVSGLFYFIFFIGFIYKDIKVRQIVFYLIMAFCGFIILENIILPLFSDTGGRNEYYVTRFPQFVLYSSFQMLNYLAIKYYYNSFVKNSENVKEVEMFKIILNINLLLLFLIVIYYKFAIFIRVFLNISLVNIIFMLNVLCLRRNFKSIRLIFVVYLGFIYYTFIYPVLEDTLYSLYGFNLLLN